MLGNQEISALSESEIYHRIQYVSQTPYLFNTSLMNNITLFKTYPQEKIQEVIRKTNLEGLLQRYQDEPVVILVRGFREVKGSASHWHVRC